MARGVRRSRRSPASRCSAHAARRAAHAPAAPLRSCRRRRCARRRLMEVHCTGLARSDNAAALRAASARQCAAADEAADGPRGRRRRAAWSPALWRRACRVVVSAHHVATAVATAKRRGCSHRCAQAAVLSAGVGLPLVLESARNCTGMCLNCLLLVCLNQEPAVAHNAPRTEVCVRRC